MTPRKPRKPKTTTNTPLHPWFEENLIEWLLDATLEQLDKILAPNCRQTFGEMLSLGRPHWGERKTPDEGGAV